ncbi:hypothetical protein [Paenibacillus agricola]|uniref:Uncharacterized protein n=1 Tax=Paenibacillus agricola TaxID=2716264 RepID=A0ABX0JHN7_9BACL|nr:hypothetical protein [Paenibacillus agricola]NHN35483.1 hypothetical protein [Paenibacillus agricola]
MATSGYKANVHYYLQKDCWSIHYRSCCYQGQYVIIEGSWSTEIKPNRKSNPRGWVTARSNQITFFCAEEAHLPQYSILLAAAERRKGEQLRYNKVSMTFNLERGYSGLLFAPGAAYDLHPHQSSDVDLFSFFEGKEDVIHAS